MTRQFLIVLSLLSVGTLSIESLHCYSGANVQTPPLIKLFTLNSTKCEDLNARCLAGNVTFTAFGFIKGNVSAALCANATSCESSCEDLADRLIKQGKSQKIFNLTINLSTIKYTVDSCTTMCCSEDHCNKIASPPPTIPTYTLANDFKPTQGAASSNPHLVLSAFLLVLSLLFFIRF